jgi:GNAT superfamily N-acetyltransferase
MALRQYLDEAAVRLGDHAFHPAELVDDVSDFTEPNGGFIIVRRQGRVVGCGAIRTLSQGVGELKRMWIDPAHRGHGAGRELLSTLEARGVALGHGRIRLDTHRSLREAIAMYRAAGFRPIPRYNDNVDATHFFEKDVAV